MSSNKWVRSISFNKNNQKDQERLKFIGRKSFSKFVKKLIDEEIKRKKSVVPESLEEVIEEIPEVEESIIPVEEETMQEEKPKKDYSKYYQSNTNKPLLNTQKPPRSTKR